MRLTDSNGITQNCALVATMPNVSKLILMAGALTAFCFPVPAVEGAFGRTVPGLWITPRAGVVGPKPGFSFAVVPVGYRGSMSAIDSAGKTEAPVGISVAGVLVPRIDLDGNSNYLVAQYVYRTDIEKVSFESSCKIRPTWAAVTASSRPGERGNRFTDTGFADFIFSPMIVGVHFSPTNNLAIGAMIFAPTARFRGGNLSNLGAGAWTVMPHIAHTYAWPEKGLELDNYVGFDIYSSNSTTRYRSGTMFHWDGLLLKYWAKNRFAAGAILGNLTQITDDAGVIADTLHGFRGRVWGAGPTGLYVARLNDPLIVVQFRAVPEFGASNLTQGITLLLGLSFKWN
jgi:hypothetical protein